MHAWRPMADSEFRCQDAGQQERVYSSASDQARRPHDTTPEAGCTHPNRILVVVVVLQVVITILLIACLAVDVRFVNDAHRKISKHEGEFEEFMKVYNVETEHQEAVTSDLRSELTLKADTILAEYNHSTRQKPLLRILKSVGAGGVRYKKT